MVGTPYDVILLVLDCVHFYVSVVTLWFTNSYSLFYCTLLQAGRAQSTTEPVPDVPPPTPPSTATAPPIEPGEPPGLSPFAAAVRASSKQKLEQIKKRKGGRRRGIQKKGKKNKTKSAAKQQSNVNEKVRCICGIVEGSERDVQLSYDWIQCSRCKKWLHEDCAEDTGVFDDDYFYCSSSCIQ